MTADTDKYVSILDTDTDTDKSNSLSIVHDNVCILEFREEVTLVYGEETNDLNKILDAFHDFVEKNNNSRIPLDEHFGKRMNFDTEHIMVTIEDNEILKFNKHELFIRKSLIDTSRYENLPQKISEVFNSML